MFILINLKYMCSIPTHSFIFCNYMQSGKVIITKQKIIKLLGFTPCSPKKINRQKKKVYQGNEFKFLHTKLSYLVLVLGKRKQHEINEVSMGLCEVSDFSIFPFDSANNLKFGTGNKNNNSFYILIDCKGLNKQNQFTYQ